MNLNDVYTSLANFLLELIAEKEWQKVELNLKIQPKVTGMSGKCYTSDKVISLRTKFDDNIESQIIWLHLTTTNKGNNKWNKAVFTLYPDNQFKIEYIWDAEYQAEVDKYNQEAMEEDPSYEAPKWHWEE